MRPHEWLDLWRAQVALLVAQLLVRTRPAGRFVSVQPASAESDGPPAVRAPLPPIARRYEWAVSRAARYGLLRPYCLVRAVALQRMLDGAGLRGSQVRIGVKRDGEQFAAHAWVEYGGRVLGDTASHVGTFTDLASVRVIESR